MQKLRTYYSNGELYIEETRYAGKRSGTVAVYDVNDNYISILEYWKKINTQGIVNMTANYDGCLHCISIYQNDNLNDSPFSPSLIEWYSDGHIENIRHSKNDMLHNTNGPAHIAFYENGKIKSINFYILDKLCSIKNIPSDIDWEKSGKIDCINYHKNDMLHNTNGPAHIVFKKGKLSQVLFYKNDLLHHDYLPAAIYLFSRNIYDVSYWRNGVQV